MSLNSAMQAGVSGLVANSVALATVSNNIANVNTIGYKQDNTQFESLVSAGEDELSLGSGGVSAITQQMIDQQGQPQQTSSPLDMAISGQGFFVVTNAANQASASTPALFTRAGSFTKNNQGYLVNSQGFFLQGWLADANGNINTNSSSLSSLQPINVAQVGGAVAPTTTVSIGDNVDSSQAVSAGAATYNASSNSMAMY
jgi:flagellar hook protein FlgE